MQEAENEKPADRRTVSPDFYHCPALHFGSPKQNKETGKFYFISCILRDFMEG